MLTAFKEAYSQHAILGKWNKNTNCSSNQVIWKVDPLHGIKNLISGIPLFMTSVGCFYHKQPILGVIYNPFSHQLYWASKNQGAFLNQNRVQVSEISELGQAIIALSIHKFEKIHPKKKVWILKTIGSLLHDSFRTRMIGSTLGSICYVASGGYDAYCDLTAEYKEIDLCAGLAILTEAGGRYQFVKTEDGKNHLICANNFLLEKMVEKLKE